MRIFQQRIQGGIPLPPPPRLCKNISWFNAQWRYFLPKYFCNPRCKPFLPTFLTLYDYRKTLLLPSATVVAQRLCFHRCLSVHGGWCTPPLAGRHPQPHPTPSRRLLQRTVCILLECILISVIFPTLIERFLNVDTAPLLAISCSKTALK